MGTNYYLLQRRNGKIEKARHIGKSSAGWCFALHVYPDEDILTLDDWECLFDKKTIKDEYGYMIPKDKMVNIITNRSWNRKEEPYGYRSWEHFHQVNHSTNGPNGLLRHQLSRWCTGWGEGTWDYIVGDFS